MFHRRALGLREIPHALLTLSTTESLINDPGLGSIHYDKTEREKTLVDTSNCSPFYRTKTVPVFESTITYYTILRSEGKKNTCRLPFTRPKTNREFRHTTCLKRIYFQRYSVRYPLFFGEFAVPKRPCERRKKTRSPLDSTGPAATGLSVSKIHTYAFIIRVAT